MEVTRVSVSHEAEVVYDDREVRVTMDMNVERRELRVDVASTRIVVYARDVLVLEVPVWSADPRTAVASIHGGVLEVRVAVEYAPAFEHVVWKRYTMPR